MLCRQHAPQNEPARAVSSMGTIRDYFETDFPRDFVGRKTLCFECGPDRRLVDVPAELHFDFDANALFVSFYLAAVADPVGLVRAACAQTGNVLTLRDGRGIRLGKDGELQAHAEELVFAGRVFVYMENDLPDEEIERLAAAMRPHALYLRCRGPRYARARDEFERPLAFISYDSSDRQSVAAPLARALAGIRCRAWFDEYSMRAGDPLESTILEGLEACERCIVVLSPRYLENQRWARREFDAIAERETRESRALIIPVRVGVTEWQVADFSPTIAHRRSVEWDPARVGEIASEISVTLLGVGRDERAGVRTPGRE
jgi:hypothetical protein